MFLRMYSGDDGQSHLKILTLTSWPDEWSLTLTNAEINFARRPGAYTSAMYS